MPQPQCDACKYFIGLVLHLSCTETTPANCDELVAAFKTNCQKVLSSGVSIDPDICDVGATQLEQVCKAIGLEAVCAHTDAVASIICYRAGVCP